MINASHGEMQWATEYTHVVPHVVRRRVRKVDFERIPVQPGHHSAGADPGRKQKFGVCRAAALPPAS
jgi:hypothetical protein